PLGARAVDVPIANPIVELAILGRGAGGRRRRRGGGRGRCLCALRGKEGGDQEAGGHRLLLRWIGRPSLSLDSARRRATQAKTPIRARPREAEARGPSSRRCARYGWRRGRRCL